MMKKVLRIATPLAILAFSTWCLVFKIILNEFVTATNSDVFFMWCGIFGFVLWVYLIVYYVYKYLCWLYNDGEDL